jgi:hypothetical protein
MSIIAVDTSVRMPPSTATADAAAKAMPSRFRKVYDVFEDVGLLLLGAFFLPVVILVLGSPLALLVQALTALFGR